MSNRTPFHAALLVVYAMAACQSAPHQGREQELENQLQEAARTNATLSSVRTEFRSFGVVASDAASEAPGLRENPDNRIAETAAPEYPDGGQPQPPCPGLVVTKVRAQAGNNCDTFKAEIAGWAEQCVVNCDPATRLAEVVLAARFECKAFCDRQGCPGPTFQPPAQCAQQSCAASKSCPQNCPLLDDCFLLQATRVWNCVCIEL